MQFHNVLYIQSIEPLTTKVQGIASRKTCLYRKVALILPFEPAGNTESYNSMANMLIWLYGTHFKNRLYAPPTCRYTQ